eukprot:scaffold1141_cov128-Isochrysis_galbana.AAC.3
MRRENDLPNKCTDTSPHIGRSRGSLYNNPLYPSQTTDLPGAPERDSATAESRQLLCYYSAIVVARL